MNPDTLSEVLRSVRLRGAVFYHVSCDRDWAVEAPPAREVAASVMPGADHAMEYHVVTHGNAWAAVVGERPIRLATGDIVVFPHGDAHVMASAPDLRPDPQDVTWIRATAREPKPIPFAYQGADPVPGPWANPSPATVLVCGFLGCDLRPYNPLIATLPRLLHLRAEGSDDWVGRVMGQAVQESQGQRPGSEAVLERLSEMMFVDAVRRHLSALPDDATGWLAGLRDRHVGKALTLLHQDPARAWTVDDLSNQVGLSRSAPHERFVHFIGQPPIQYLGRWRMQLAANLLRASHATVASIALEAGYDSEAAFSRAFKRIVGVSPAAWRRQGATA